MIKAPDVNFGDKEDGNSLASLYSQYFELTLEGEKIDLDYDDLLYFFLSFKTIIYENGTEVDVPSEFWLYLVYDDFYIDYGESEITITTSQDIVTYEAYLIYEDGSRTDFLGKIDLLTGFVHELMITYLI